MPISLSSRPKGVTTRGACSGMGAGGPGAEGSSSRGFIHRPANRPKTCGPPRQQCRRGQFGSSSARRPQSGSQRAGFRFAETDRAFREGFIGKSGWKQVRAIQGSCEASRRPSRVPAISRQGHRSGHFSFGKSPGTPDIRPSSGSFFHHFPGSGGMSGVPRLSHQPGRAGVAGQRRN